jgi:hypothetical protein
MLSSFTYSFTSSLLSAAAGDDCSDDGATRPEKEARLPYIRVELVSTKFQRNAAIGTVVVVPPPVPHLMQPHVSIADWNTFWSILQPIQQQVRDSTAAFSAVLATAMALYLVAWVLLVVLGIMYQEETAKYFYPVMLGVFAVVWLVALACNDWHRGVRACQFHVLCDLCRQAEKQIFGPSGYAVQCAYDWEINAGVAAYGFHVYFYPVAMHHCKSQETKHSDESEAEHNGYLRVQLFKTANGCSCSRTPFSLPYLETFQIPPIILEQVSGSGGQELWTRFWSEMLSASRHYLWTCRVFYPVLYAWLVLVVLQSAPWFPTNVYLILHFGLVILLLCMWCRLLPASRSRAELVKRYADEFARCGYHVEYRRCYEFDDCSRMFTVHYLYVFPLPATTRHDNRSDLV